MPGTWFAMAGLIVVQVWQDVQTLFSLSLRQRIASRSLTSIELVLVWGAVGLALYTLGKRRGQRGLGAADDEKT